MPQKYLYTVKIRVGYQMLWSLHTLLLMHVDGLGQHRVHSSSASFPEPWASCGEGQLPLQVTCPIKVGSIEINMGSACPHGFLVILSLTHVPFSFLTASLITSSDTGLHTRHRDHILYRFPHQLPSVQELMS